VGKSKTTRQLSLRRKQSGRTSLASWEKRLGARIVNYADDFVILCRGSAAEALERRQKNMNVLKLTVNETKTKTDQPQPSRTVQALRLVEDDTAALRKSAIVLSLC
jgi:hypothetical protein